MALLVSLNPESGLEFIKDDWEIDLIKEDFDWTTHYLEIDPAKYEALVLEFTKAEEEVSRVSSLIREQLREEIKKNPQKAPWWKLWIR